jgi:hypothetical protein
MPRKSRPGLKVTAGWLYWPPSRNDMLFLSLQTPLNEINFLVCCAVPPSLELAHPMAHIALPTDTDLLDPPLLGVEVRLSSGAVHMIDAAAGFNAMELIRAAGGE